MRLDGYQETLEQVVIALVWKFLGGSLAVSVTGSAITVTVGTGSTVDDVIKAVNASAEANALVKVSRESNTTLKTGIVQAQASANLANGSDTATWAIIAEVTNFNRSGLSASVTEVTHFCSPDQVKEKISSVVDSGDATMTANFVADDIESQSVMRNSLLKNELRKFDVVYGGTYTSHRFDALVTSFDGIQASIEDAITMEIGLTLSGKPSFIDVTE